jgi:hypothetical protein
MSTDVYMTVVFGIAIIIMWIVAIMWEGSDK